MDQDNRFLKSAMLQFVPPKLTVPSQPEDKPPKKDPPRLDPEKIYFFGSTHVDVGGCSYYRILFVSQLLSQIHPNAAFCDVRLLFNYQSLLPVLSSFRLQRACATCDIPWFRNVILSAKKKNPFPLIYEIDDILVQEDIPIYNSYRDVFKEGKEAISIFMDGCDVITVTCAPLADYYSTKFGFPLSKFRIMPNYLPRYFFDSYDEMVIRERIRTQKTRKPRICFSCGLSHFDVMETGEGDDFSGILDWIVDNRRKYEFVFHGGFPPALEKYQDDFECIPVGPFLDYPRIRRSLRADLFIQPLRHSVFNECKSPIKLLESWAEGVPAFVQDLGCYTQIAPEACFDSPETIDRMVNALFADPDAQIQTIRANYARMDAWWLDNHLDDWLEVMLYPNGR